MSKLHDLKDAKYCLGFFQEYVCPEAQLIGSFGKGLSVSSHDIDIYLPNFLPRFPFLRKIRTELYKQELYRLLKAKGVENTDWGGWYFTDTIFGDVDVFFDISEFDY